MPWVVWLSRFYIAGGLALTCVQPKVALTLGLVWVSYCLGRREEQESQKP